MRKLLLLCILIPLSTPAFALYKCQLGGKITYSDEPCRNEKAVELDMKFSAKEPLVQEMTSAREQAAREKIELNRLETERRRQELREDKERQKLARAHAAKQKKCSALALQTKWAEEDAAAASGKSAQRIRRNAQRKAEKFQLECGK